MKKMYEGYWMNTVNFFRKSKIFLFFLSKLYIVLWLVYIKKYLNLAKIFVLMLFKNTAK